ncbi:MAG TPA: hypothetical protein ENH69_00085 [Candidatus Aerophobetes bacterium]|uniref:Uncharacterized protein n=1 Tax=Aerophobetes bacterium TaxID=2030807 RepID=A0A7C1M9V8_UNCAE|nr:hypothetical protein [Candidatus Aerophobetes bacterium]
MKKKKVPKKRRSFWFIQPAHPYKNDICIFVGMTWEQVDKDFNVKDKSLKKFLETKKELFEEIMSGKMNGYKLRKDDTDHLFLILPPPKNNWEYWETLLHETAHLVQDLAYMKMLGGETEAQAYLHEHLFRSIRRKIMGLK